MPMLPVIFLKTGWITFFYLTKEFIILSPRGRRSGLLKCVCGMAMLQKRRVCSDELTRTRPTSKLMNKLSIQVLSFSWDTPKNPTRCNKCKSSNIFTASKKISSTSQIVVFFRFNLKSADITNKQAGCSLTYCFSQLICREESQPRVVTLETPLLLKRCYK